MKRRAAFAVLALLAAPATAADAPHRPWGWRAMLSMPFYDAQRCLTHKLYQVGRVDTLSVDGGTDLDLTMIAPLSEKSEPQLTFRLRATPDDAESTLTVLYRHPFVKRFVTRLVVGDMGSDCLMIARLEETPGG